MSSRNLAGLAPMTGIKRQPVGERAERDINLCCIQKLQTQSFVQIGRGWSDVSGGLSGMFLILTHQRGYHYFQETLKGTQENRRNVFFALFLSLFWSLSLKCQVDSPFTWKIMYVKATSEHRTLILICRQSYVHAVTHKRRFIMNLVWKIQFQPLFWGSTKLFMPS